MNAETSIRPFNRAAAVTRSLLGYGVIVGPFYLALGLGQALFRDGFDFQRHALSHLANGPYGWIQVVNLLLTGAMVIAAAVGMSRVGGRPLRWVARLLAAYGVAIFLSGIFRADPVPGLPPGTPETASMSILGLLHFAFGALGFLAFALCCFVAGRAFLKLGRPLIGWLSVLSGVVVLAGFLGPAYLPSVFAALAALWIAVIVGWVWLGGVSAQLYRTAPPTNC